MIYTAARPSMSPTTAATRPSLHQGDGPRNTTSADEGEAARGDSSAAFSGFFDDPENVPISSATCAVQRELAMFTTENCVQQFGVVLVVELDEKRTGMILKQVSENVMKYGHKPANLIDRDVSELLMGPPDVKALRHAILQCKRLKRSGEKGINNSQGRETLDKARLATEALGGGGGCGDTAVSAYLEHIKLLQTNWMHTRLRVSRGFSCLSSRVKKVTTRRRWFFPPFPSPAAAKSPAVAPSSAAAETQGPVSSGWEHGQQEEGGSTTMLATVAVCNIESLFIVTLEEYLPVATPEENFAMTLLSVIQTVQKCTTQDDAAQQLANACSVQSGADRVMIYKFDPVDYHGEVVAERRAETVKDSFLGMHFPAQDIPVFARLLFMRTPFRMIVDVESESVHMYPRSIDRTSRGGLLESVTTGGKGPSPLGSRLDTSDCVARWANGCHLQYLANMGVRGSFTVPIVIKGKLWGLVCHHHQASPLYLPISTRYQLALLAGVVAVHIDRLNSDEMLRRMIAVQRMLSDVHDIGTTAEYFRDAAPNLLQRLQCTSILLLPPRHVRSRQVAEVDGRGDGDGSELGDVPMVFGTMVSVEDVRRVVELVSIQQNTSTVFSTHKLGPWLFPPSLLRQRQPQMDSGCCVNGDGSGDCGGSKDEECTLAGAAIAFSEYFTVVCLRREFIQTVRWAGRDNQPVGDGDLTPRWSFSILTQQKRGESLQWSSEDIQFVSDLRAKLVAVEERRQLEKQRAVSLSLSVARDVALRMAQEKSSFLAHMSHELRTPFNGMIGFLELLLQTDQTKAQRECASTAYECAVGMLEILDDVLLVSKLESGKVELRLVPFDVVSLVNRAQSLMLHRVLQFEATMVLIAEQRFSTTSDIRPVCGDSSNCNNLPTARAEPLRSLPVLGDAGRLRQVILNLLSNAIKFTGHGGRITMTLLTASNSRVFASGVEEEMASYVASSVPVSELKAVVESLVASHEPGGTANHRNCKSGEEHTSGTSGGGGDSGSGGDSATGEALAQADGATPAELRSSYVKIAVADTGTGIAAEQVPLLFRPFTQLDDGPSRRFEGTGLGLVICKELVQLMGGRIILSSTKGKGSCFMVLLRLMDELVADTLPLSPTTATHRLLSSRASTVDDENELRMTIRAPWEELRAVAVNSQDEERLGRVTSEVRETSLSSTSCHSHGSTAHRGGDDSVGSERTRDSEKGKLEAAAPAGDVCAVTGQQEAAARVVMVVDDNKVNQRLLIKMLGCVGRPDMRIEVANDGREALALAQRLHSQLECIFMDLHMPDVDGLESCRRIRAWELENGLSACEIVGLTADVVEETQEKCLASGMNRCLSKPIDLSFLKNFLNKKLPG